MPSVAQVERLRAAVLGRREPPAVRVGPVRRGAHAEQVAQRVQHRADRGVRARRRAPAPPRPWCARPAPAPRRARRSPSSATRARVGCPFTKATGSGSHCRVGQPAATAMVGRQRRSASAPAAGDDGCTSRRACGSGMASTTRSACSPSTSGPGPTCRTVRSADHVEPRRQLLDQAAQPGRGRPAHRPGRPAAAAVLEHGRLGRPRPGQARRPPAADQLGELRVGHREVGRAQVDRAPVQRAAGHPAADHPGPLQHRHRDPGRAQLHRARHPGDPGSDNDHGHAGQLSAPRRS